jgi:hypothetical protein
MHLAAGRFSVATVKHPGWQTTGVNEYLAGCGAGKYVLWPMKIPGEIGWN